MRQQNTIRSFLISISFIALLYSEISGQNTELVIIDEGVSNSGILATCMKNNVEVLILENNGNQLENLTRLITARKNLEAIHLFFSGKDGLMEMNGVTITNDNLATHLETLGKWKLSFKPGADMMIYTCDLAHSNDGKGFLRRLSAYTGLDVAASVNQTGSASGDWILEFRKGEIESDYCFTSSIGNYPGNFKREILK